MDYKGNHCFTNSQLVKYHAMRCENPRIHLETVNTLNPADLLPTSQEPLAHDCIQVVDEVYTSRPGLKDRPLGKPDVEHFTDGSSFVKDWVRYASYAMVPFL